MGLRRDPNGLRGFTLIEVLIVVSIILICASIVFPVAAGLRDQARLVTCSVNLRQLALGLNAYAAEHGGRYPPNVSAPEPARYWFDPERIQRHLAVSLLTQLGKPGGSILACPADSGAARTYAMNLWASSEVDAPRLATLPARGRLWGLTTPRPSQMILLSETWSSAGSDRWGWLSPPTIGYAGETPGQRFGAGSGIAPPIAVGRFGWANSELAFALHRPRNSVGLQTQPIGRVNIAYADGSVRLKDARDLAAADTGQSRGDSFWSPTDLEGR